MFHSTAVGLSQSRVGRTCISSADLISWFGVEQMC